MKSMILVGPLSRFVLAPILVLATGTASAARENPSSRERLPNKLPAKVVVKRTFVDFSKDEASVVLSPRAFELSRLLKTSDQDLKSASAAALPPTPTVVRSRKIMAAPEGDSAEPMSAMSSEKSTKMPAAKTTLNNVKSKTPIMPTAKPTPAPITISKLPPLPRPTPAPEAPIPQQTIVTVERIEPQIIGPVPQPQPMPALPAVALEPTEDSNETVKASHVDVPLRLESDLQTPRISRQAIGNGEGFLKSFASTSMVFIRSGYYNANYKKFDDRMRNGATSIGIAAARGIETTWGEFEVRAAFDVYHAIDQSVTVDNIRMFTARTEVAYWLSHSRVKPGLSLGLGIADYSIRSYRSISDSNEGLVTLKTHAKSRAFTVIPATSLRVELAKELVIDAQTEFIAMLGGDSTDAAQGLGINVSLGWMF